MTQSKIQMFGAWCGLFYMLALIIGWCLIAGFIPPHLPSANAEAISTIFHTDMQRIRIGMIIVMFAALIFMPFASAIGRFMAKIEGNPGVLTYLALLGGAGTMVLTFYPAIWWLVAAYRPDRHAGSVQLLNDMAWLQLVGGISLFLALPGSMAVAAFCDNTSDPVFPRWSGFFNIWISVLFLPDQLMFFFYSGPFAWNGLIGFWIPLVAFAAWFVVTFILLRKAILRERNASGA